MNISLTPELEKLVKSKVDSGLYNNASEVIREALRFMLSNEELIHQIRLDRLTNEVAAGFAQIDEGKASTRSALDIFEDIKQKQENRNEIPTRPARRK